MIPTLAVLAGGEGSRMGRPKGLLEIGGMPILAHLLDQWRWDGPTLLVTAPGRERPPACERFDREVVDDVAGEGPLRGLATALRASQTLVTIVTTCDMPGIARAQIDWLAQQAIARPETLGLLLRRGEGQIEPFPSVFRSAALSAIVQQLGHRRRAMQALASLPNFALLDAPSHWPAATWANLNSPADLEGFGPA